MIVMKYMDYSVSNINATSLSVWELQLPSDTSNIKNTERGEKQLRETQV